VIRPVLEAAVRLGIAPVRVVSPLPPHEPEPYPDEPFAPVYDYEPLGPGDGGVPEWTLRHATDPYGPDRIVFGPGQQTTPGYGDLLLRCARCDVKWAYGAGGACWYCGRPG
jgi:hypothetical protein